MGVSLNHPFIDGFSLINHPAIGWLVVLTILKNMKVNGKDMKWKIKAMFEITNQ